MAKTAIIKVPILFFKPDSKTNYLLNLGFINFGLQKLTEYFFSDFNLKKQSLWFKNGLYIFLLFKCINWLCFYEVLFGNYSIMYSQPQSIGWFKDIAFLLYSISSPNTGYFFIVSIGLSGLFNLVFKARFPILSLIIDSLIWFCVINVHNKIYLSLTAGDYLLNQFVFFNCFIRVLYKQTVSYFPLIIFTHNLAVLAVIIQVCFAYFMAGFAKIYDADWWNGNALAQVMQIQHYNLYGLFHYNGNLNFLYKIINYFIIFYQLTFPVLVWVSKIKKPLLLIGVAMHLYIALIMGLLSFGIVMILGYIYFWPNNSTRV